MSKRLLAILVVAVPLRAYAPPSAGTWTIAVDSGVAVMGQVSGVNFRVTNTGTTTLAKVVLQVNQGNYDLDSGLAPVGWSVSAIDKQNRKITYSAACASALGPGQSAVFTMNLIGIEASTDQTDGFVTTKTDALDCSDSAFSAPASWPTWKRVGLAATITTQPRTLDIGTDVTVTMTLTNRTGVAQGPIAAALPTVVGGSAFGFKSGPTPSTLNLGIGASGTMVWTFTATGRGIGRFQSFAQNQFATVTSNTATSLDVDVGSFPAQCDVIPTTTVDGGTVTVRMTVGNNSVDPYQSVAPNPPSYSGTAKAQLLSGPTPTSVPSLPAGTATSFSWTYRINGSQAETYSFVTQGTAIKNGVNIATDPVGSAQGMVGTVIETVVPQNIPAGSSNVTIAYTVTNGGGLPIKTVKLFAPDSTLFTGGTFVSVPTGWTTSGAGGNYSWSAGTGYEITSNGSQTFSVRFTTVGTPTVNSTTSHRMQLTLSDTTTVRVEAPVTVFLKKNPPEVSLVVATGRNGRNFLGWSNPVEHDGVLILRTAGVPANQGPDAGTIYAPGAVIGNSTVVYTDSQSFATTFSDQGLSNGQRYYYRIYNHDQFYNYAAGNQPSSSGVFSEPSSQASGYPRYCYSVGVDSRMQPVTELGNASFSAGNAGFVGSNLTLTDPDLDGSERWRPTVLAGAVQSRFPVVPLQNRSGTYILTGDQKGYAYAVNAQTGAVLWRGNGGGTIGDAIQAQPVVQLYNTVLTTAAYKAARTVDSVFVSTYNVGRSNNRVWALSGQDGSQLWAFSPGNMDQVSGGGMVAYPYDQLWIPSKSNGGTQPSIWVINTLTGALVQSFSGLGDFDNGIVAQFAGGTVVQALAVNNAGVVYGFDLATRTIVWQQALAGGTASYVWPTGSGFIAALKSPANAVERWTVSGATATRNWTTPITSPSGVTVHYATQKIFVGSGDGKIHQLDAALGTDEKSVGFSNPVTAQLVGTPTIDSTVNRLTVGLQDGRVCAINLPLP